MWGDASCRCSILEPRIGEKPISAEKARYRGFIALAANGVGRCDRREQLNPFHAPAPRTHVDTYAPRATIRAGSFDNPILNVQGSF